MGLQLWDVVLWDSVQEDRESGLLKTCSGFGLGTLWGSFQADRRWVSLGPIGVSALGHCGIVNRCPKAPGINMIPQEAVS